MYLKTNVDAKIKQHLKYSEMGKLTASCYEKLTLEEKNYFEDLSIKDRMRYDEEIKVYNQKYLDFKKTFEFEITLEKNREIRARSAFNFFTIEYSKNSKVSFC